jgi:ABC-type uncharacterized transport system involved in gliding motility auxiliary subunit
MTHSASRPAAIRAAAAVHAERGTALAVAVHVVLLLLVLGQIVYLASRHRVRVDLTSDRLWSPTESTRQLLDKLDKRLVVEAYFSPKDKLPVVYRETRSIAEAFLDELVQLGKGKVVVQRFDPNADTAIEARAKRCGVQSLDLQNRTSTSVSVDRHWQGLRLLYGGGKQRVIAQFAPGNSFLAEAVLTPAIKEVTTEQRRKYGYMEWPATAVGAQQPGGIGWNMLRTFEGIAKRYEFQNFKDEDGALLPADCDTLFLFRPKELTDRQKYVIDQFVVRGGTLVLFADAAEYAIGPQRSFSKLPLQIDAAGSKQVFVDQLLHYGIDWKPKLIADMAPRAHTPSNSLQAPMEYFALPQQNMFGQQQLAAVGYPYFFHPLAFDWSTAADDLAKNGKGEIDRAAADSYRQRFGSGMPSDEFLFKAFKQLGRGPGLYWPTWVGLREKAGGVPDLPPGVEGRVLLRSSPFALAEDPPASVNPIGYDPQQRTAEFKKFNEKLVERYRAEPRQQVPLMVDVRGRFPSFFAGQDRPKRPSEIKEEEQKAAAAAAKVDDPNTPVDESKPDPDAGPQPDAVKPVTDGAALAAEAPMLTEAVQPGRIVAIGDADFVRDDLVNRTYAQQGGPCSMMAGPFFAQLLDWLAEDRDLVELQSRSAVDRTLKFVDGGAVPNADPRLAEQELRSKTFWLRAINLVLPGLLLAGLGLAVFLVRRAQKRAFLASLG